jgi:NADH:ubiquinone oxidoreductase subunit K
MLQGISQNIHLYLTLSAIFFVFGILAALSRKNAVGVFMGIELMLNAAALNFVAFQALRKEAPGVGTWLHGHIFALFIIILAAIEAAVALAIVLRMFAAKRSIDPDRAVELRG